MIAAVAAVVPIGTLILMFPEGGWFPFTVGSLLLVTAALSGAAWCGHDRCRSFAGLRWCTASSSSVRSWSSHRWAGTW